MSPFSSKTQGTIWVYPEKNPFLFQHITTEFNIHPVAAQILISRGFIKTADIHEFLYAKLPNLYDPHLFPDMETAVTRVIAAIQQKQIILVYGDNDVDGMTAAALLTEFLKAIGASVYFHIPNRPNLQKSIAGEALEFAIKKHCSLMITVDCGITAAKEIQEVVSRGIDVIVTDHHEPTSKIPSCIATLNPKLINSTYPNRDLTGVGVAFKLAHAITNYLIEHDQLAPSIIDLKDYLDLVALGTIADMGALKGENRILVRYGLRQMKQVKRVGLAKLFLVSEVQTKDFSPMDIASKIAPRLNSLGRVADPNKGVELLLIKDSEEAEKLAKELDLYNIERQKIEKETAIDIEDFIFQNPEVLQDRAIVLASEKWHPGVIPIIAARIAKQYSRPILIIAIEKGIGKGSMRTIPEFPLVPVLKANKHLLINFGGHDYAAGLTIREENISAFKQQLIQEADRVLQEQDITPKLYLDAKVNFDDLTFDFMESLNLLEPFGNENPHPILYCDALQVWLPKVVGKYHLKLFLEQGDRMLEGIAFGLADRKNEIQKKNIHLRIAFTPHINLFLNKASIQLQIKDFHQIG
ncbi:MAG: single-stranded-DNA-specific exonuclease RecJ [Chlamydiae bacterium RIFCSPHIGHO2_12_FULL_44_59]|nr:MAG: single-stranded-DNA-specific exonuclease RecJ [Chlamydiae bacterium RIFCSPHIGHO2_01_FULL_44_39]OGN60501.1 MAG: single-stranded-DNA-specific exonuclease RecJ [Chlamydiae bacterium RIFCSPHIGHO2_12_FULL_44_59]OGN65955.1 MAG: single-stranded-DNA-specific exonuclease RecJ [Chlamydiae bacterium RIFCSPLOWO2_01_FULL_44_52]OGN68770.1 MAG: single-stranded-DNA-specific exonuclease RecJ [Chlamydiae bacterium RIFCSPLOWO2_02_FULL_45_22]OGN70411.1 MAG: single-stranded-DNA-specific exonuclease RecJ [Ch